MMARPGSRSTRPWRQRFLQARCLARCRTRRDTLTAGGGAMSVLTQEARRVVEGQRLGFVATVNADGTPNLSPKGTVAVLDDEHLVFADIRSPRTIENLRRNPALEINVVDP